MSRYLDSIINLKTIKTTQEYINYIIRNIMENKRHKHADVIHAYAEGAEIQVFNASGAWSWEDIKGTPYFLETKRYRVKPKGIKKHQYAYQVNPEGAWTLYPPHLTEKEWQNNYYYYNANNWVKLVNTEIEVDCPD